MAVKKVKKSKADKTVKAEKVVSETPTADIVVGDMSVSTEQVRKAIVALTEFAEKQNPKDQMVFDDSSQSMTVQFNLNKASKKRFKPVSIKMPHSLWNDQTEVCLVVKEPQRRYKDMLEAEPRPAIKKVIDVKKWKQRHDAFKDRRQICDAFELFLIDTRCAEMIPSLFGKSFSSRNKTPIPVDISKGLKGVDKQLACATLRINGSDNASVKFGRANFSAEKLAENCNAVIAAVAEYFHGKKNGISSISIQATGSPTLPVYCAPVKNALVVKKSKAEKAMKKSKSKRAKVERSKAKKVKKVKSSKTKAASDDEAEKKVLANTLKQVKVVEPKKEKPKKKKGRKSGAKTEA